MSAAGGVADGLAMNDAPVTIHPVQTRAELDRFIDLPWSLYERGHPQYAPPLRMVVRDLLDPANPFYREADRALFVAKQGTRVVGRIAAIENRAHNAYHHDRTGFYGFFECVDSAVVAEALFEAAGGWLRARGLTSMRGPVNPSMNHECGLLVQGFRWPAMLMTPWTPRHYVTLHEQAGFTGVKDLLAYFLPMSDPRFALPPAFVEHANRARNAAGLTFRALDFSNTAEEAERCRQLYVAAWERNWGFVPPSREEFLHLATSLKPLLIRDFAFMAEVAGEPAGFLILLPDFNHLFRRIGTGKLFPTGWLQLLWGKRRLRSGRIVLLGVAPRFRTRSILELFAHELYERGRQYGAVGAEGSWILEDNHLMTKPLEALGAKVYRRWRLYERVL